MKIKKAVSFAAILLLLACSLVASACYSVGHTYSEVAVSQLKIGVTTEAEAIRLLGRKPTHRQTRLQKLPMPTSWVQGDYFLGWARVQINTFTTGVKSKSLLLMFNKNGILKEIVDQSETSL